MPTQHTQRLAQLEKRAYALGAIFAFCVLLLNVDGPSPERCHAPFRSPGQLSVSQFKPPNAHLKDLQRSAFLLGYLLAMLEETCVYMDSRNTFHEKANALQQVLDMQIDRLTLELTRSVRRYRGCTMFPYLYKQTAELLPAGLVDTCDFSHLLFSFERWRRVLPLAEMIGVILTMSEHAVGLNLRQDGVLSADFAGVCSYALGETCETPELLVELRTEYCSGSAERPAWGIVAVALGGLGVRVLILAFTSIAYSVLGRLVPRMCRDGRRVRLAVLVLFSAASGAGLLCLVWILVFTLIVNAADNADVVAVFGLACTNVLSARMIAYCKHALSVVYDRDHVSAGHFVLFLRSFDSDDGMSDGFSLTMGIQQISEEEQLVDLLADAGPLVACQDPRIRAGSAHGLRVRLSDEWKTEIVEAMKNARLIVVRCASTAGVSWELQQIEALELTSKTLYVMPDLISASRKYYAGRPTDFNIFGSTAAILKALWCVAFPGLDCSRPWLAYRDNGRYRVLQYHYEKDDAIWFSRFRRGVVAARALREFASRCGFAVYYGLAARDLCRDLLCVFTLVWFTWLERGPRGF